MEPDGSVDRYVEGHSRYGDRHSRYGDRLPLVLSAQDIQDLEQLQPFTRAREIVDRWIEDATSIDELENKTLLAILQFGSASSLNALEVRLQNYLTVPETLYGRELIDDNDDFRKAARRLSLSLKKQVRERFREEVRRLYAVRRHPVHYGARNLRGRELVSGEDVQSAQHIAFQAVTYALQRAPEFQSEGSHEAFIDALDADLSLVPMGKRKCLFVAWRDRVAQRFRALAPDFPGIQGEGATADQAYRHARAQVEADICGRSKSHGTIPGSTAVYREPQLILPSDVAAGGGGDVSAELGQ